MKRTSAFTLIELSIVLVIIGLIVGGVLVGRDLISAAAVRAQIAQIEKYNTSVNTFKGKFNNYLPGDIPEPYATQFGFMARGAYAAQGDGNNLLEGYAGTPGQHWGCVQGAGETIMFWSDLAKAGLVDGSFTAARPDTLPSASVTGSALQRYFPPAKIGNNSLYAYTPCYVNDANYFAIAAVSALSPGSGCGWCVSATPGLSVAQAYSMDKKIDDGIPTSGRTKAYYSDTSAFGGTGNGWAANAASDTSATCYNSSTNQYSIAFNNGNGMNCALSFQFQ